MDKHFSCYKEQLTFITRTRFNAYLEGSLAFGWHNKSIGSKVILPKGEHRWLRVSHHNHQSSLKASASRIEESNLIKRVNKPFFYEIYWWEEGDSFFMSALMDYIESSVFSITADLTQPVIISDSWLENLDNQLNNLSQFNTSQVSCRQNLITRRIAERFGSSQESLITQVGTIHQDLHWANLTKDPLIYLRLGGMGPWASLFRYSVSVLLLLIST